MHIDQYLWTRTAGWTPALPADDSPAQLVFLFGGRALLQCDEPSNALRVAFPHATCVGCSTAGEVAGTAVHDDTLVATAVHFERCTVESVEATVESGSDGAEAARRVASALVRPGLRHMLVFCDGLLVKGDAFAHALRAALPAEVCASGGLAADGDRFAETVVCRDGTARTALVVAVGLYGDALRVGYGSLGGWDSFGPARRVTRSAGDVLFELDGESALGLYKTYLGEHSRGLPGSALHFPLLLEDPEGGPGLVRAVLGVDEAAGSLIFAGAIPEGTQARLMKANVDRLIDGASGAAGASVCRLDGAEARLALLVSCVARRLVLRQRVEEELEAVREVLPHAVLAGFYSYGELCPQGSVGSCELHNQTMTITTFAEA
jgi:hypothetical protein